MQLLECLGDTVATYFQTFQGEDVKWKASNPQLIVPCGMSVKTMSQGQRRRFSWQCHPHKQKGTQHIQSCYLDTMVELTTSCGQGLFGQSSPVFSGFMQIKRHRPSSQNCSNCKIASCSHSWWYCKPTYLSCMMWHQWLAPSWLNPACKFMIIELHGAPKLQDSKIWQKTWCFQFPHR